MRPVDDRLYIEVENTVVAKHAVKDEGGKDQKPEIDVSELIADTPENETKEKDIAESDDLSPTIKLGEFVRQPSQLARAHDFSRTSEPELGMS